MAFSHALVHYGQPEVSNLWILARPEILQLAANQPANLHVLPLQGIVSFSFYHLEEYLVHL